MPENKLQQVLVRKDSSESCLLLERSGHNEGHNVVRRQDRHESFIGDLYIVRKSRDQVISLQINQWRVLGAFVVAFNLGIANLLTLREKLKICIVNSRQRSPSEDRIIQAWVDREREFANTPYG